MQNKVEQIKNDSFEKGKVFHTFPLFWLKVVVVLLEGNIIPGIHMAYMSIWYNISLYNWF